MDNYYRVPAGEWINANQRFMVPKKPVLEPRVDEIVSKAVGFKVFLNDPRLIRMIVKWKKQDNKPEDSLEPDRWLEDPKRVEELKQALKA